MLELLRHYPDDGEGFIVERDGSANDAGVAAELRLPESMAYDGYVGRAEFVFISDEVARRASRTLASRENNPRLPCER